MFAGEKAAQIREVLISESAWEELTRLFAPSLAEHQCVDPAINLRRFPNTGNAGVWSSSAVAGDGNGAWSVGFGSGSTSWGYKGNNFQLRLVRSVP